MLKLMARKKRLNILRGQVLYLECFPPKPKAVWKLYLAKFTLLRRRWLLNLRIFGAVGKSLERARHELETLFVPNFAKTSASTMPKDWKLGLLPDLIHHLPVGLSLISRLGLQIT